MKLNKILIIIFLLFVLNLSCGVVFSADNSDNNLTQDNQLDIDDIENIEYLSTDIEEISDISGDFQDNDKQAVTSKTITIVADKKNPNQVLNPTVQPAIDAANPGDTIILKGTFIHCHFLINKQLNIITSTNAILSPCPHHQTEDAGNYGVFYIVGEGSGTLIQGFTFSNSDKASSPFSCLIRGASNITIKDCTMNYVNPDADKYKNIVIENSNNVNLENITVNNTIDGIIINESSNIKIINSYISNNVNNAISVLGNSNNITLTNNIIEKNSKSGINLLNVNNVKIINNFISENGLYNYDNGSGIYVNSNITNLIVKGNIFLSNGLHAIMYDYRTRNLNNEDGADKLSIVDNNYFSGHSSMILHHRVYIPSSKGGYRYDEENDVYISDSNGNYTEAKSYSYMLYAFIDADSVCGYTYYTTIIPWNLDAPKNNGKYDLSLRISNITQLKKGKYKVSIVDKKGKIASDLSSFNVTFYLNNFSTVKPKETEIYKSVKIQNGTAIVDFTDMKDKYLANGNVITASFPGFASSVETNPHVQFSVDDIDIPGVLTQTSISAKNITLEYNSGGYIHATLSDIFGKKLSGKSVAIMIAGKTFNSKSDDGGNINLKVNLNAGTYKVIFNFAGDDEYSASTGSSMVIILKLASRLEASTLTTYPISDAYLKTKLCDSKGNALANQKVTFKINGKTFSSKTDKNGMAKVKVSLTNKKIYNAVIKFAGTTNYKPISKTVKIAVKTGSKKSKITAKNIKIKRNTKKVYKFKLTSKKGKAISKQKVIVKLNGKSLTVKTNKKGMANVKIKLNKVKKYKINMKFLGNSQFKAVSKTSTIKIRR